jgi:hypothetical protein
VSNLAYSPAVHEAAYHPPSDAERLYADGEGDCNCHINGPCNLCCSLNEVEADIMAARGIAALHLHWNQVAELRVDQLSVGY